MRPEVQRTVLWALAGLASAAYIGALIVLGNAVGSDGPANWVGDLPDDADLDYPLGQLA